MVVQALRKSEWNNEKLHKARKVLFVKALVHREKSKLILWLLVWVAKEVKVQILRSLLLSLTLIGQASMDEYVDDHAFVASSECNDSRSDASPPN